MPGEFVYQRRGDGGLGVPCLDAHFKCQRLSLLLRFMRPASKTSERNWTTAGVELLVSILPQYGKRNALDFLTISPLRHGELIQWNVASIWW
ncbi:hypothetical protein Plhal304r1_c014g0052591 [Plasmopara halstedii]